jgi:hypothetical protein
MNAWDAALYSRLQTTSGVTSLLAGTTSIYHLQPPEGAALPYIIYNIQAATEANDSAHRVKNIVGFIRAYSGVSAVQAGSIDAAIDTALHMAPLTVTGWSDLWMAREQELEMVENQPSGKQVFMAGGFYRAILERTP